MISESEVYEIGQLGKPHGIKGEINFSFNTDVWDRVEAEYLICEVDGILVPFFLEEYRFRTDRSALLKFRGIDTPESANDMNGWRVFFPYSLTPQDEEEEYSWQYFTGFTLQDEHGNKLGTISVVDETTTNILFEVDDLLIPAAEDLIKDIDHQGRVITMHLPEGLTDL